MKTSNQRVRVAKGNGGKKLQQGNEGTSYQVAHSNAVSSEKMVAEAAYFLAERHGFDTENTVANWLQAEVEVTALLASRQ